MEMFDNKKTISASEINKYIYCPYQWYYERLYGRKYIREIYKERNEQYGFTDSAASNFNKGLKFHRDYLWKEKLKFYLKIIMLALFIGGIIFGYFYLFNK